MSNHCPRPHSATPLLSLTLSLIILAPMNMETEEPEVDDVKPQLDQEEPDSEDDSADVPTQTLWEQAETQDQFAP